jgi:hypothetical protein
LSAVGLMFSPKGTVPLAPRREMLTLASLLTFSSIGRLNRQSTSWEGSMTRLPRIARSLNCDFRTRPGTAWVRTRATA